MTEQIKDTKTLFVIRKINDRVNNASNELMKLYGDFKSLNLDADSKGMCDLHDCLDALEIVRKDIATIE